MSDNKYEQLNPYKAVSLSKWKNVLARNSGDLSQNVYLLVKLKKN